MVRKSKKTREEWKVYKNVFDEFTIRTLVKLISKGFFDGLASPISLGKEANVFTAERGDEVVCVKIYRLESCDFNQMYKYIRTDPRFFQLKHQRRQTIFAWTQREYRNLMKAREVGVSCPKPLAFLNNCLVMDFVGSGIKASPRLKDLSPKNPSKFFNLVLQNMKKLHKTGFVHGDLSEYNILNFNERPILIDFSHAVPLTTPNVEELIEKDVKNVIKYFKKFGVKVDISKVKKSFEIKQK